MNENLAFEYGDGATAAYGCGATLNGEFWYFGYGQKVSFPLTDFILFALYCTLKHSFHSLLGQQNSWLST